MAALFTPLNINQLTLKNRIVVSPMCQYSAVNGMANNWHLVHLGGMAVGGAGLILLEATAVSAQGRISPGDLGLYTDEQIAPLQQITQFIHQQDALVGVQLAHAGRKASHDAPWTGGKQLPSTNHGWKTIAPSALAFAEGEETPHAMTMEDIELLIAQFMQATQRALKAGFDVIELHAAHGYLLHQFLSPLSNHRTDSYGGSFENRIRLLLQVVDAVKTVWPKQKGLFVRISATDWVEGGWSAEESVKLSALLKQHGVDLVDCSTGGLVPYAKIPVAAGYQVPFAQQIKQQAGVLTGAVGLITTPQQAEDIIATGQADVVLLARELLRDPHFALRAAHQLGADVAWPKQYDRAQWRS